MRDKYVDCMLLRGCTCANALTCYGIIIVLACHYYQHDQATFSFICPILQIATINPYTTTTSPHTATISLNPATISPLHYPAAVG